LLNSFISVVDDKAPFSGVYGTSLMKVFEATEKGSSKEYDKTLEI
jgi:hypothetical protein